MKTANLVLGLFIGGTATSAIFLQNIDALPFVILCVVGVAVTVIMNVVNDG
jgi:uncharacterized membrane protein YcaP (DUF421 family)